MTTEVDRIRPLRDLGLAVGFLTILPFGRDWPEEGAPDAVGFYPWVGWVLGLSAAIPCVMTGLLPSGPPLLLLGALVVAAWAWLTRFLHWDGLADSADGLLGSFDRERRLEIMRDSRVGAFGAVAMVLVALVQTTALVTVLSVLGVWPLIVAPVIARAGASLAAWTLPAARREGLGLTSVGRPSASAVTAAALAVAALALLLFLPSETALSAAGVSPLLGTALLRPSVAALGLTVTVGLLAAIVVPRRLARGVGGMTGDLFGATVLLVETATLVTAALIG